jgi:hypothetical protein
VRVMPGDTPLSDCSLHCVRFVHPVGPLKSLDIIVGLLMELSTAVKFSSSISYIQGLLRHAKCDDKDKKRDADSTIHPVSLRKHSRHIPGTEWIPVTRPDSRERNRSSQSSFSIKAVTK